MKKIITVCLFLLSVNIGAYAQDITFYDTNQKQINWDQEFNKIPTDQAKWNIYIINIDKGQTKENPTLLASAVARPYLVQVNSEGTFFVGVSALRVINANVTIESNILWSDKTVKPFGLKSYTALPMPSNLRAE